MRDQASTEKDFAWWNCRQRELEADLAQPSEGSVSTEYTAYANTYRELTTGRVV